MHIIKVGIIKGRKLEFVEQLLCARPWIYLSNLAKQLRKHLYNCETFSLTPKNLNNLRP